MTQMTLDQILTQSPPHGAGQHAFYSARCCWWTSYPDDRGNVLGTDDAPLGPLPCCPHCHSVLLQAPLADFIASARANPTHYGPHGLDAFVSAHSRNAAFCHPDWAAYNALIELARAVNDVLDIFQVVPQWHDQSVHSPDPCSKKETFQ